MLDAAPMAFAMAGLAQVTAEVDNVTVQSSRATAVGDGVNGVGVGVTGVFGPVAVSRHASNRASTTAMRTRADETVGRRKRGIALWRDLGRGGRGIAADVTPESGARKSGDTLPEIKEY